MNRKKAVIIVEIDLDPVPGWGDDPKHFVDLIQRKLDESVPHYNPTVRVAGDLQLMFDN